MENFLDEREKQRRMANRRILKQEIAKYNAFDIDERYFQLKRDLEICEQFLRETEPEMFKD